MSRKQELLNSSFVLGKTWVEVRRREYRRVPAESVFGDQGGHPQSYSQLILRGEIVDFNRRFIQVQRSFRNGRLTPTKTGKSRRVDMSNQLYQELKDLLIKRKEEALKAGSNAPVEIIFHTDGGNTSQNSVRNVWKRLLRKAGLSDKRIHDIRHTYASTLLSTGASPVFVKEQLGHSSIQMTVDIYGHLIPSSNREIVNRLDSPQLDATQAQPAKLKSP